MEINSLSDLDNLENRICQKLRHYKLGDVLYSLYEIRNQLRPFITAGIALFAIRCSSPSNIKQNIKKINIIPIVNLVSNYLLADPITLDKELQHEFIESNPVFLILRLVSSQFPFNVSEFTQYARPMLLYHEIPNNLAGKHGIPTFDVKSEFYNLNGVSIADVISIGFVAWAAASNHFTFSLDYFRKARLQGINLPDDKAISLALAQLASDSNRLKNLYEQRKNADAKFRMYDFNPLLQFPIILPCRGKGFANCNQDFMCAPVPDLINERLSSGVFYQLFNAYKEDFSKYFGHVLEEYVGIILRNSITSENLLRELDIRSSYPESMGKVPDYAVIDGSTAILIESKATRFNRAAQTISTEDAINDSLKQVIKGLRQLNSFINACQSKLPELYHFHGCTTFKPVFVSLEPMYLINSGFFRDHINQLLASEGVVNLNWQILSVGELEALQPHLTEGIHLSQVTQDLEYKTFSDVLRELCSQTNKTYKDSFLYPKQEELYQRLGIRD